MGMKFGTPVLLLCGIHSGQSYQNCRIRPNFQYPPPVEKIKDSA